MLESEKRIREFLQSCNGGGGDIRHILDAVVELAQTDRLAYEGLRKGIASTCGIRASILDGEVLAKPEQDEGGPGLIFVDPEPSPEPVDGGVLLDQISAWLSRYVVLPDGAPDAIAAWSLATWFRDETYVAPVLTLLSPTKRCGKSLLLDLLSRIVRRPLLVSGAGITMASIFRVVDEWGPCLLIDEAERLNHPGYGDMVALLNAGHRMGGWVLRCKNETNEVQKFDSFGYRALASIARLPGTILDRSVIINMERKTRTQHVDRFVSRQIEREGEALIRKIVRFFVDHKGQIKANEMEAPRPSTLNDRACDSWAVLFAIASVAGGGWVDRLLKTAGKLEAQKEESDYGEQLVLDIEKVFKTAGNPEAISSGELASQLREIETSPWGDLKGSGLSPHGLARRLKKFSIRPRLGRTTHGSPLRGYWLDDLKSVFLRYTPPAKCYSVTDVENKGLTPIRSVTPCNSLDDSNLLKTKGCNSCNSSEGGIPEKKEKRDERTRGVPCYSCRTLQDIDGDSARCANHRQEKIPF